MSDKINFKQPVKSNKYITNKDAEIIPARFKKFMVILIAAGIFLFLKEYNVQEEIPAPGNNFQVKFAAARISMQAEDRGRRNISFEVADAGDKKRIYKGFFNKSDEEIQEPTLDSIINQVKALGREKDADFLQLWTNDRSFRIGELISYHFLSNRNCHLILICITSDGSLQQIFPNKFSPDSLIKAKQEYMIPEKNLKLEVVGPKGTETIIAIVSEIHFNPLYASFDEQPFFSVDKDNKVLLNKISKGLKTAKSMNLSQKMIRYSIRGTGF